MASEKSERKVTNGSSNKGFSSHDADAIKIETVLGHKQELGRNFDLFSLTGLGFIIAKYGSPSDRCLRGFTDRLGL